MTRIVLLPYLTSACTLALTGPSPTTLTPSNRNSVRFQMMNIDVPRVPIVRPILEYNQPATLARSYQLTPELDVVERRNASVVDRHLYRGAAEDA